MESRKDLNEDDVMGVLNTYRKIGFIPVNEKEFIETKKRLEIIKTKRVNIPVLMGLIINEEALNKTCEYASLALYNSLTFNPELHLTIREYDLLKEWLNNER